MRKSSSMIRKKLKSERGESIAEVLITALVVALGALLLVAMVVASRNIIQKSERAYNTYLNERNTGEALDGIHSENSPADSGTVFSLSSDNGDGLILDISENKAAGGNAVGLVNDITFSGTGRNRVNFYVVKENETNVLVSYKPADADADSGD